MKRPARSSLIMLPLLCIVIRASAATPGVEFSNDRLTLHLTKVAVADVIRALEAATGADVHGKIPSEGDMTIDVEAAPLREGLDRLFGERNFAITYRADGRPLSIELFGGPLPALRAGAPEPPQSPTVDAQPWPSEPTTLAAIARLQAFLERNPSIDLPAGLAKALGSSSVTFRDLLRAAATNDAQAVRARAWRLSLRTLREDAALWSAFTDVVSTAPEDAMRDFMRHLLGPHAEELTRQLTARSDPQVRGPARMVLQRLQAQPRDATAGVLSP